MDNLFFMASKLMGAAFRVETLFILLLGAGLVACSTDYHASKFQDGIGWNFSKNLANLDTGIKEWIGLLAYRLTGRTRRLLGDDCAKAPNGEGQSPASQSGNVADTDGQASAKAP